MGTKKAKRGHPSGLASALFSGTQQKVLALLFGQPHRSFFATEIMSLARCGRGTVQRELRRLEESGLVVVTQVGNQKHFQANRTSPLFEELRSIVQKTVGLAEPIRTALAPLAKAIKLGIVYGSVAKGADTSSSDIDLLVVSDELRLENVYRALAAAEKILARRINPNLYTVEEFRRRRGSDKSLVSRIMTGRHLVLFGDQSELATAR